MPSRHLNTSSASIDYSVDGNGPSVLVFVHGWGCRRTDWAAVIAELPEGFTAVAIDLPGHGASTAQRTDYTIGAYADDVAAVMREEGMTEAVLVGHSMGGAVVLDLAARYPTLARRVIGVDSFHYLSVYPAQEEPMIEAYIAGFGSDLPASIDTMVEMTSLPSTSAALKEQMKAEMRAVDPQVGLSAMAETMRWDMDAALDVVDVPVSVLAAEPLLDPQAMERYRQQISFTPISGASHYFLIDTPRPTANKIVELVSAPPPD